MDQYIVVLTGFGVVVLLTAWLPMLFKELPLSLPIACVAIGAGVALLPMDDWPIVHMSQRLALTERLTEIVLIVALMGAGLKLDRPLDRVSAALTSRLLVIAMPMTIAVLAALGVALLGLGLAAALLLGAALAPTDPVLASDVQVGAPGEGKEDAVRFTLTSEAGLNDGLAFPFVHLAIALAISGTDDGQWLRHWLAIHVAWKVVAGVVIGWAVGRVLGWLIFRLPNRARLSRTGDGFVALGITCLAYGIAELAHAYGFLAVFVAALQVRAAERHHRFHEQLHDFVEQLERLLMMVLLIVFGFALVAGGLLAAADWRVVAFALLAILVVRPLSGWLALLGRTESRGERAAIAFFGIRGLGSAYYLAYALDRARFDGAATLWSAAGLIVLISILLHGTTVTPVMRALDRRAGRTPSAARSPRAG